MHLFIFACSGLLFSALFPPASALRHAFCQWANQCFGRRSLYLFHTTNLLANFFTKAAVGLLVIRAPQRLPVSLRKQKLNLHYAATYP